MPVRSVEIEAQKPDETQIGALTIMKYGALVASCSQWSMVRGASLNEIGTATKAALVRSRSGKQCLIPFPARVMPRSSGPNWSGG